MSKYGIIVNAVKCVGCHACFAACKAENLTAPGVRWNHLERVEHMNEGIVDYFRVSCMHCEEPKCMAVCPAKAISKGPHGEVLVDGAKCIACHMCEAACPYHAPKFSDPEKQSYFGAKMPLCAADPKPWTTRPAGKAEHCTLCVHRTSEGGKPACVEACPTGALTFVDYEKPDDKSAALIRTAQMMNEAAGTGPKVRFISKLTDFRAMTSVKA